MATQHVSEATTVARTLGGIKFGVEENLLVNANLSSLATAKAAVLTAAGGLHISQKNFASRVNASLDKIDNYSSGFTSGTDVTAANSIANYSSHYWMLNF